MSNGKVIVLRGVPGSGKSTVVKKIIDARLYSNYVICSADDFRIVDGKYMFDENQTRDVHTKCMAKFLQATMIECYPVVFVDNTNISLVDFMPYVRVAEALGYDVEVVEVQRNLDNCAKENIHGVPREVIDRMWESIDYTHEYLETTRI